MGGMVNSGLGFLGLGKGPQAPGVNAGGLSFDLLNDQNSFYNNGMGIKGLQDYANGNVSSSDYMKDMGDRGFSQQRQFEGANALATNPLTGSKFATEQAQNDPIMGQLFGQGGQLSKQIGQYGQQSGILDSLQNQGFQLKPEDQTLYGQASGNIARNFGAQGNKTASGLASRGLSNSGAAGAAFSGLAGNQNEQLAQAQQQIMQQRFQNTKDQISQQQNFLSSLGGSINQGGASAENAVNQQYGRQLSGAQNQRKELTDVAGLQNGMNASTNEANMAAAGFNAANAPKNAMDFFTAGAGQGIQSSGASLFGKPPEGSDKLVAKTAAAGA